MLNSWERCSNGIFGGWEREFNYRRPWFEVQKWLFFAVDFPIRLVYHMYIYIYGRYIYEYILCFLKQWTSLGEGHLLCNLRKAPQKWSVPCSNQAGKSSNCFLRFLAVDNVGKTIINHPQSSPYIGGITMYNHSQSWVVYYCSNHITGFSIATCDCRGLIWDLC